MTKQTEALRMAIEVMDLYDYTGSAEESALYNKAIQACKEALAETQEPVAWVKINKSEQENIDKLYKEIYQKFDAQDNPLTPYGNFEQGYIAGKKAYTTPPSREWVGLSDRELFNLSQQCNLNHILGLIDYGRAIEAKLREKNG